MLHDRSALRRSSSFLTVVSLFVGLWIATWVPAAPFVRGDGNADGGIDTSDAIYLLGCLFLGSACPTCDDAADANDDGNKDIGDPIFLLNWLFLGGVAPATPSSGNTTYTAEDCGADPTADALGCESFAPCPEAVELAIDIETRNIYTLGQTVQGSVVVRSSGAFNGNVALVVFDELPNRPQARVVLEDDTPVSLASGGERRIPFSLTPDRPGHYVAMAAIQADVLVIARQTAHFGVRPQNFPAEVPDTILRAQIAPINAATVRQLLEQSASSDQPVDLRLGPRLFRVQGERMSIFTPLSQVPGELRQVGVYKGALADDPESLAVITVGPENLHASIIVSTLEDDFPVPAFTTVEPLGNYQEGAPASTHLIYDLVDTIAPDETHADPIAADEDRGQPDTVCEPTGEGGGASHTIEKTVMLKIYEHQVDLSRSLRRLALIATWAGILEDEFQDITPRQCTSHDITVSGVEIDSWQFISSSGYTSDCEDDILKFRNDHSGTDHRLYVLFSDVDMGCGGIAFLGQGSRTDWHSIVKDTHDFNRDVAILGQEAGHNLDWHSEWDVNASPPTPHDPHLDVSETWNWSYVDIVTGVEYVISTHCTIMRSSYCAQAFLKYSRRSDTALRHLAEGLYRYF
jgi:hypothetical protein